MAPAVKEFLAQWGAGAAHPVGAAPVRLLAVVNRIDLAQCWKARCQAEGEDGDMRGAEIRFEYAAYDNARQDYLRLIVEFVLPCLNSAGKASTDLDPANFSFAQLAQDWQNLSDLHSDWSKPNRDYQKHLEQVLAKWIPKAKKVRVRAAGEAPASGPWGLREYAFQAAGGLLPLGYLEKEVWPSFLQCVSAGSRLGRFVRTDAQGNPSGATAQMIQQSRYDIPMTSMVGVRTARIEGAGVHALTLAGDQQLSGKDLEGVRQSLSINSCRGCHGPETETQFVQLGQRSEGETSSLSGFLTGNPDPSDNGKCLPGGGPGIVQYCGTPAVLATDCNPVSPRAPRFNDLLRRRLYLDTVLHPASAPGSDDWCEALMKYGARQVH